MEGPPWDVGWGVKCHLFWGPFRSVMTGSGVSIGGASRLLGQNGDEHVPRICSSSKKLWQPYITWIKFNFQVVFFQYDWSILQNTKIQDQLSETWEFLPHGSPRMPSPPRFSVHGVAGNAQVPLRIPWCTEHHGGRFLENHPYFLSLSQWTLKKKVWTLFSILNM